MPPYHQIKICQYLIWPADDAILDPTSRDFPRRYARACLLSIADLPEHSSSEAEGAMALLKYFKREKEGPPDGKTCPSLTQDDLQAANAHVRKVLDDGADLREVQPKTRGKYNYTPEQRAQIGKYAAENGPTRAAKHFSQLWKRKVPEPTARRLKAQYL